MSRLRDRIWARELLGICEGTLGSMIARRQLPFVRISPRLVRFDEDEILAWLAARRVPARAKAADELEAARTELRQLRGER